MKLKNIDITKELEQKIRNYKGPTRKVFIARRKATKGTREPNRKQIKKKVRGRDPRRADNGRKKR